MAVRVHCINKDGGNHENPYVAISHLGWIDPSTGKTGKSTRVEMHQFVKQNPQGAYVETAGSRAYLIAETSPRGNPYVKTLPNDTERDNLLKLPECR